MVRQRYTECPQCGSADVTNGQKIDKCNRCKSTWRARGGFARADARVEEHRHRAAVPGGYRRLPVFEP